MEHVKQIYHLMPEAYQFRAVQIVHLGKRIPSVAITFPSKLGQSELMDRRERFHMSLLNLVKAEHAEFLAGIGVKLPADAKLRSWHPKFSLESVKDIPIREVLPENAKVSEPVSAPEQILEVIREVSRPQSPSPNLEVGPPPTPPAEPPSKKGNLKGSSLLERIKAKERQSELAEMIHPVDSSGKTTPNYQQLSDLASSLTFLFGTSGKSALLLGDVITKITAGAKNALSTDDVADQVKRLCVLVPEWISLVVSGQAQIVKIDKRVGLREVQSKILANLVRV